MFKYREKFLTFTEPCIVMFSYNKNNKMKSFFKFIFGIGLYIFRTGFLFIKPVCHIPIAVYAVLDS